MRRAPPLPAFLAVLLGALLLGGAVVSARAQATAAGDESAARTVDPSSFVLPEGLELTVWAETPQLYNPTSIDVDEEGRIWVVESVDYRAFNNPAEDRLARPGGERILILEDSDGDGRADSSRIFAEDPDLVAPLGIAVFGDRVVVSAAPSVYVYTDTDGDDRADEREVLLSGFGGMNHDHAVHGVTAAPDGRWVLNTGNAGPHVVTDRSGWTLRAGGAYTGGTPYHSYNQGGLRSDDGEIYAGGVVLSIRPDGTGMRIRSHNYRNPYEVAVDSYGSLWTNDNDDEVRTCRTAWVMDGSNAGYFSADGTRFWHQDRRPGQDIFTAHWHQQDPGVLPAGDRTGAGAPAGITVYEGDALGERFRGWTLSADAGRNAIFGYPSEREGAGYRMDRRVFLRSVRRSTAGYVWHEIRDDPAYWFRPSDVAVGTDGAIYVADWYDPVVGGHAMRDSVGFGRIYRVGRSDTTLRPPRIDLDSTTGQLRALRSPAPNVRHVGYRRLLGRGPSAIDRVRPLLEAENPYHRARAVWLLARLGEEGRSLVRDRLDADRASLRVAALRALEDVGALTVPLLQKAAADPSPGVRREVALALEGRPIDRVAEVLVELAARYPAGGDRWYLEALGRAASGREERVYALLRNHLDPGPSASWSARFADLAWRLHPVGAIEALGRRAGDPDVSIGGRERALTALGFTDRPEAAAELRRLSREAPDSTARSAAWWLEYRERNEWHTYLDPTLAEAGFRAPADPTERRRRLQAWALDAKRAVPVRAEAAEELAAEPAGARRVLVLIRADRLPARTVDSVRTVVFETADPTVRALADAYLDRPGEAGASAGEEGEGADASREADEPGTWREADELAPRRIADLRGDPVGGEQLFFNACGNCHRLGGEGHRSAPDLDGYLDTHGAEALVKAIVRPGEALASEPRPLEVVTESGEVYVGFEVDTFAPRRAGARDGPAGAERAQSSSASADAETLRLRGVMGRTVSVARARIVRRTELEVGLMPSPVEQGLDAQDVADFRAFLENIASR